MSSARSTFRVHHDNSALATARFASSSGRVSITQDVYLGRRACNAANLAAIEAYNPDRLPTDAEGGDAT